MFWIAYAWSNVDGRNWRPKHARNQPKRGRKLIQVKEGKGIQEEEGLTKSKFPNPSTQSFQPQRGILGTLGHLIPCSSRVPHLPLKSLSLAAQGFIFPFLISTKISKETYFLVLAAPFPFFLPSLPQFPSLSP